MTEDVARRTRVLLTGVFAVIAALLVMNQLVAYYQWKEVQRSVDAVDMDALVSVQLVDSMAMDVERERNLIARHIFESEASVLSVLEARIDATKRDLATTATAYAPLARFPGEADAWRRFTDDVASIDKPIAAALELSRVNRDAEASARIVALEPTFDRIEADATELVAINRTAADQTTATTEHRQFSALLVRLALAAAVLLVTLAVGLWATRVVVRIQEQMVRQRSELEVRNRELDAFAGRVAHDLRGPLNTITLSATMLAERVPSEVATTTILHRGIRQMANLVEDLLGLSRVGAMVGSIARTEPVAAALETDLGALVNDAGGTLRIDLEPAAVSCSQGLLRQILWNLGENAVKYRRPDVRPVIDVVGRRISERYRVRVTDNGMGMSREDATHVFEPFYRCDQTKSIPGTGLGLAIVRRVVEASGGTIAIDSEAGRGTTFMLDLPLAQAIEPRIAMPAPAHA